MSAEGAAARPPATSGLASPEAARRVIDLFEDVQRHTLVVGNGPPVEFTTDLTRLQRRILRLLGCRTPSNAEPTAGGYSEKSQTRMCGK
jgi:hypothetical protein